jgi:hypothetical protein
MHLYLNQDKDEGYVDLPRKRISVDYGLTEEGLKDCVTAVDLHIHDPEMETWSEVLREMIQALETLYGYEFDLSKFEK